MSGNATAAKGSSMLMNLMKKQYSSVKGVNDTPSAHKSGVLSNGNTADTLKESEATPVNRRSYLIIQLFECFQQLSKRARFNPIKETSANGRKAIGQCQQAAVLCALAQGEVKAQSSEYIFLSSSALKEVEEYQSQVTGRSDKLYDDSEDDLFDKNTNGQGTFQKSMARGTEDGQSFGDYIQKQISSYFDHTNVSAVTTMASTVSNINIMRSHMRTKSTETMHQRQSVISNDKMGQGPQQSYTSGADASINKRRRPLSSVRQSAGFPQSAQGHARKSSQINIQQSSTKSDIGEVINPTVGNTFAAPSLRENSRPSTAISKKYVRPPQQSGAELDSELCKLYKLLNQDCQQINMEKRQKVVMKSAKKGIKLKEKDVNLLEIQNQQEEVSSTSIDDEEEEAEEVDELLGSQTFGLKLHNTRTQIQVGSGKVSKGVVQDFQLDDVEHSSSMSRDGSSKSPMNKSPKSPIRSPNGSAIHPQLTKYNSMILHSNANSTDMKDSNQKVIASSAEKKKSKSQMKRRNTDVTLIQDIVKRKRITFLKSSNLFSQEEQLFGGNDTKSQQTQREKAIDDSTRNKNKKMIRSNLEEKKKIEGAIEKMSIGGDRLILETIGRQIQFAKEKEFIYKLLIGQAMGASKKQGAPSEGQKNLILNQLKEKQDSHGNVMALLIEKVLSDDETRERLLDQSVLNDFYFEEKLKEKRLQVIQEQQRSQQHNRGRRKRRTGGTGDMEVIDCNLGNEVLDSLQHLPEVIKPEHIKVNISGSVADRGKIVPPKEKDNIYHRSIVKKAIQANLNSNRLKMQRFSNLQIINFILHYTTAASKAESRAAAAAQTYSTIVNLRKVYAYTATLNSDKFGHSVNFSKWITLTKQVRSRFRDTQVLIDTVDLERVFYEIVKSKSPAEMQFEDFVEGLRSLSRRLAKVLVKQSNESQQTLLANEDFLFNRFLTDVLKPLYDEMKNKDIDSVFECQGVQNFFYKTHNTFFRKLYANFKEYPVPEQEEGANGNKNGGPGSFLNPLSSGIGDDQNNSQGISMSHINEVMKVLNFNPQILSKHELQSLFVQSLTMHEALSYSEFIYFNFLLFTVVEDKQRGPPDGKNAPTSFLHSFQSMTSAFKMAFIKQTVVVPASSIGPPLQIDAKPEVDQQKVVKRMYEYFITPQLNLVEFNKQSGSADVEQEQKQAKAENVKVTLGGEAALERIKDCHNDIILNRLNSKAGQNTNAGSAFGKHYSVNIKANIM